RKRQVRAAEDVATGCGAIALALRHERPDARVVSVEASAAAREVARRNARRLGLGVEWRHGRWCEPLAGERYDVIVANPPYVAEGDAHLAALAHEPRHALVAGSDGLDAMRALAGQAPKYLTAGG